MFNAVSQAWCVGGWRVMGRVRAGSGVVIRPTALGLRDSRGRSGSYPTHPVTSRCPRQALHPRRAQQGHSLTLAFAGKGRLRGVLTVDAPRLRTSKADDRRIAPEGTVDLLDRSRFYGR